MMSCWGFLHSGVDLHGMGATSKTVMGGEKASPRNNADALSHGLFKRSGFVGMFTIGELARKMG